MDESKLSSDLAGLKLTNSQEKEKVIYVGIDLGEKSLDVYKQTLKQDNKDYLLQSREGNKSSAVGINSYDKIVDPGHVTLGYHSDFPNEEEFHRFMQHYNENETYKFKLTGFCYDKHALAFMVETNPNNHFIPASSSSDGVVAEKSVPNKLNQDDDLIYFPEGKHLHVTCLLNGRTQAVYSNRLIKKCLHFERKKKEAAEAVNEEQKSKSKNSSSPKDKTSAVNDEVVDDELASKTYDYYLKYFDKPIECDGKITFYTKV